MTLDTSNEEFVDICVGVLDKVRRCLFGRNGNKRDSLVRGLEPNNFRAFNRSTSRFVTAVTFTFATLSFLLLLGGRRRRTKQSKSTREELARHTLDDGDDMSRKLRLDIIRDSAY